MAALTPGVWSHQGAWHSRGQAIITRSAAKAPAPFPGMPERGFLADGVWCQPSECRTATCRRGLLPRAGRPRVFATPSCRRQVDLPNLHAPSGLPRSTAPGLICQTCSELRSFVGGKLLRGSRRGLRLCAATGRAGDWAIVAFPLPASGRWISDGSFWRVSCLTMRREEPPVAHLWHTITETDAAQCQRTGRNHARFRGSRAG